MDENLIKYFIGKNSDTIYPKMNVKGSFNVFAFFFTSMYFIYRKMYLVGIISFIIEIIIFLLVSLSPTIASLLFLIYRIACGALFYPLYKSHVENKISNITEESNGNDDLVNLCIQKGGISVIAVILLIFLPLIIILPLILVGVGISLFNRI